MLPVQPTWLYAAKLPQYEIEAMLFVRKNGTFRERMPFGKRARGVPHGLGAPLKIVSPSCYNCDVSKLIIAAVRSQGAVVKGGIGSKTTEIMMDSGSSISLVIESLVSDLPHDPSNLLPQGVQLVSAAGDPIPVIGNVTASIRVGNLTVYHPLVVVQSLIVPVILGMDFLQTHGLTLDFTTTPVTIRDKTATYDSYHQPEVQPVLEELRNVRTKVSGKRISTRW